VNTRSAEEYWFGEQHFTMNNDINSPNYKLYEVIRWRLGNRCCLLRNDCSPLDH